MSQLTHSQIRRFSINRFLDEYGIYESSLQNKPLNSHFFSFLSKLALIELNITFTLELIEQLFKTSSNSDLLNKEIIQNEISIKIEGLFTKFDNTLDFLQKTLENGLEDFNLHFNEAPFAKRPCSTKRPTMCSFTKLKTIEEINKKSFRRQFQVQRLIDLLKANPRGLLQKDIPKLSNLSQATVSRIINELADTNIITRTPFRKSIHICLSESILS